MDRKWIQEIVLIFCKKWKLNVQDMCSTMSRTQVQLWYNRFKESREDVNNNARSGRPIMSTTDENMEAVKKLILDNSRITIREGC